MGDALPELLRLAPLGVHVMRVEVAGLPGVEDDIGLGDGASQRASRSAPTRSPRSAAPESASCPPLHIDIVPPPRRSCDVQLVRCHALGPEAERMP